MYRIGENKLHDCELLDRSTRICYHRAACKTMCIEIVHDFECC